MTDYTIDATIRRNLLAFPSLFKTPAHVLAHVLLVNGNGFRWEAGQPVPWRTERETADDYFRERAADNALRPELLLYYDEQRHAYEFTKANIDRIVQFGPRFIQATTWRPEGLVMDVPEDAQSEWLELAASIAAQACAALGNGSIGQWKADLAQFMEVERRLDGMLIARGLRQSFAARVAWRAEMAQRINAVIA